MILRIRQVLQDKKGGVIEPLGALTLSLGLIVTVGLVIGNYAIHSKKTEQLTAVSQEIVNRAETYAATMNLDLLTPQTPPVARECSVATEVCTQILSVTPSEDTKSLVLRIQGDTVALLGQTVTKDVTIESIEVSHVTGIDADGNNSWGLAPEEGLRYRTWGVASGEPTTLTPAELEKGDLKWVSIADRAGVDSAGGLWVWGPNNLGQAGNGDTSSAPIKPEKLKVGTTTFRSVLTADNRGYAIDSQGFLWVWGNNARGQLKPGASSFLDEPVKLNVRVNAVAAGEDNTFALTTAGELWMQGSAQSGLPAPDANGIVNKGTTYRSVSANPGGGSLALVTSSGEISVYGTSFTLGALPSPPAFAQVAIGSNHGVALTTDGKLYTFGNGSAGQLGLGATVTSVTKPTAVMPDAKFTSIGAGRVSSIAVDSNGKIFYTGNTGLGASPDYALPSVNTFTTILESSTVADISAEGYLSTVVVLDVWGNVYTFGTPAAGIWPADYSGAKNVPVRMPLPDVFDSYTWK